MEIRVANQSDLKHVAVLVSWYKESAKKRGTGIAERKPEYLEKKILDGDAIVAINNQIISGFSYIETFDSEKFVVNSGLIILQELRKTGLGQKIKNKIFELSRTKYPKAKIFSITTSLPVMKLNTQLGFKPVTFSELTDDEAFWRGCKSCKNYEILMSNERKMCLCTGLVYDNFDDEFRDKKK